MRNLQSDNLQAEDARLYLTQIKASRANDDALQRKIYYEDE